MGFNSASKGLKINSNGYHHFKHSQILRSAHTAVFMCFAWISEQTTITSLYNIN